MSTENPRNLALEILNGLNRRPQYANLRIDQVLQAHSHYTARNKALISHLVLGVIRWRLRLDWMIEQTASSPSRKISPAIRNILRLALLQIFFMDRIPEPAAVNEAVKQAKRFGKHPLASFVNGILRNVCREKDRIPFPDREKDLAKHLSVFHSFPVWLVKKWLHELGRESTEGLLAALNRLPVFSIRTNIMKLSRRDLLGRLQEEGVKASPSPYLPSGILIEGASGRISELCSFSEGLFQVQDQGAQMASYILAPRPAEALADICAGLGGKATHLAELTTGRGKIVALDINYEKLIKLKHNSRRLGIDSILPLAADASKSLSSLFRLKFDKILLDAPCSGFGVLSRHPDGKWNRDYDDIKRLAFLQKRMMGEAAAILGKGGRLLYMTCTISKEENEEVVEDFLEKHQEMALENIREHIPAWGQDLIDERGFLRTFPHRHDMDGFFGALFLKQ